MRATDDRPVGRVLARLALDLDGVAGRIERDGVQGRDWAFLEAAHLHVQIAVERLDDALAAVYAAEERELRRQRATPQERRDAANVAWKAAA